jgi:cytochrome c5
LTGLWRKSMDEHSMIQSVKSTGPSDRSFLRSFAAVAVGLHLIILTIIVIAWSIGHAHSYVPDQLEQLRQRVAPFGVVVTDASKLPAPPTVAARKQLSGDQIVAETCSACHQTGMLGAPKIGDTAVWKTRLAAAGGIDGLVHVAITGVRSMPPRGGRAELTDSEIRGAIQTMLKRSGAG